MQVDLKIWRHMWMLGAFTYDARFAPYSVFKLAKSLSRLRYKNCKQFLLCWSIITKSMHNRSFKVLFNAFHSVRITNSPVHMQGWAHNHRMHAFKYGKKEHFAIDFQVLHKKRNKVFRENRLHNIVNPLALWTGLGKHTV